MVVVDRSEAEDADVIELRLEVDRRVVATRRTS
jgi:hypothetical protein